MVIKQMLTFQNVRNLTLIEACCSLLGWPIHELARCATLHRLQTGRVQGASVLTGRRGCLDLLSSPRTFPAASIFSIAHNSLLLEIPGRSCNSFMLQSALPPRITVLRPHKTPSLKEHRAKNQRRWKQMTPQKPEQGCELCCSLSQWGFPFASISPGLQQAAGKANTALLLHGMPKFFWKKLLKSMS